MSSAETVSAALDSLRQAHESGRLSHAYVLVGSPRGDAGALAESLLQLLFCTAARKPCGTCAECRRVLNKVHPDVHWLEPAGLSRQIKIEHVRELIAALSTTAYGGGWKAAVIVAADRLSESAANAFLKTLEEPPPSTLLLLLTDRPSSLLPTIRSRCQRVSLSDEPAGAQPEWADRILGLLRAGPPPSAAEAIRRGSEFSAWAKAFEEELEEKAGEAVSDEEGNDNAENDVVNARFRARTLEERGSWLRMLLLWHRDVLLAVSGSPDEALHFGDETVAIRRQAASLTLAQALENLRAVEALIRRLDRNLPAMASVESLELGRIR